MIEQLLEYDTELFLFLNGMGSESWDDFWNIVTEKWSSIPLYAVLLVLIVKHYGWKEPEEINRVVISVSFNQSNIVENIHWGDSFDKSTRHSKITTKHIANC